MSANSLAVSPEEQRSLERFYFQEARLLDNRQYQQWLAIVTEEVRYLMPARGNPMVDNSERGHEHMISVERELEDSNSLGCPIREEGYVHLMLRVERAFKINSWSENPPARTRRLIGNIEVMSRENDEWSVLSNFHLYYARPGNESVIYSGQRRDVLKVSDGSHRIQSREVIMDYADIELPTLGLLF
jgi:3-phenylpropionate/cinnamic acid dioxygenase small subunit